MISYIIPCYKKLSLFDIVLPMNTAIFNHSKAEVVIVADEPTEEAGLIELAKQLNRVRLIVNDNDHDWRPPCVAINVGIRNSTGDHIVVVSPESYIHVPRPTYLFEHSLHSGRWALTGSLAFSHIGQLRQDASKFDILRNKTVGFGFIMFRRADILKIHGYNEQRKRYGGDDDDIRVRLKRDAGVTIKHDPKIHILHPFHPGINRDRENCEPFGSKVNQTEFGVEFSRIAFQKL